MAIIFHKFQGAGNDFILIDDRADFFEKDSSRRQQLVQRLCNRNFGAGADGLMLLKSSEEVDFEMHFFNSDGLPGSFCGNGARCIVAFADFLGISKREFRFIAADGLHRAIIQNKSTSEWDISVEMADIQTRSLQLSQGDVIHTGSPHIVLFRDAIENIDVYQEGKALRYAENYTPAGINVNFAQIIDNHNIKLRTYERGVEGETLACGTGATAAALASWLEGNKNPENQYNVHARGGILRVRFDVEMHADHFRFSNIRLSGPAIRVYGAEIAY